MSPDHLVVAYAALLFIAPRTLPSAAASAVPPPSIAAAACDAYQLPPSVHLQAGLEPVVRWALRYSPTFRRQCRALAAVPGLTATVRVGMRAPGRTGRARAIMRHDPTGAVAAEIEIINASDMVELIAHEFEHLIEQLDGVNLGTLAEHGEARLLADGAFETPRAVLRGQQVAGEVIDNAPDRVRGAGKSLWRAVKWGLRLR